jgi:BlaI family transcriptional regulator, penicillinase repressor
MAKPTKGRGEREPNLPDSELEVMRVLWKRGKATARDVWTDLTAEGSKWTYATVNTLLQRLEAKGMATADKSAMTYVYAPKLKKEAVIKKRIKQLVEKLYDGHGAPLAMHVLRSHKLSKDDLSELKSIVSDSK